MCYVDMEAAVGVGVFNFIFDYLQYADIMYYLVHVAVVQM